MTKIFLILIFIVVIIGSVKADELSNQTNPLSAYDQNWQQCNHHLIRKGFVFKVADVDWFSPNCQNKSILNTNPVLLRFTYFRHVKREFFIDSATEYFLRNLDEPKSSLTKDMIMDFNQSYQDVTDGDVYDLLIDSDGTLNLFKNKQLLKSSQKPLIINNYFNIWFGQQPVLPALKEAFIP